MVALLDRLGKTQPAEEGVPSVNMEQLASATKDRAQATAEHAMQLASDAKNTLVEKACSSTEMVYTSAVQAEALVKWRAQQATRLAENRAMASMELVDHVASSTQAALVDGSERMVEVVEEVRDCFVEKAEVTRDIMAEKADGAAVYWQDTGTDSLT